MTDNDIVKALKCCADKKRCHDCPFCVTSREPCYITLAREAASLLTRRDAEIERLKDMVGQNEGVLPQYENLIKAEAIKEFAERLKAKRGSRGEILGSDIDNLVKEMTEE